MPHQQRNQPRKSLFAYATLKNNRQKSNLMLYINHGIVVAIHILIVDRFVICFIDHTFC